MAGEPYSLAEVIRMGVESRVDDIFVARPGEVTAYDPLTNTAVVKPAVKRALYKADGERVFEELPEIPFVPVIFPRVGDFALTLPVAAGTPVLLLFCDVSLAEWRENGQPSEPTDARRHSIGWPVAFVGFYPDTQPMSADPVDVLARSAGMVLGKHGADARIEIGNEIKLGKGASDYVALASKVDALFGALKDMFDGWTVAPADGGAALKALWTTLSPDFDPDTGATLTKAK